MLSSGNSKKKWVYFGLGAVAGGVFILVVGLMTFFMLPRMCMRKKIDPNTQNLEAQGKDVVKQAPEKESLEFLENISRIASLKVYSFTELQAATENFSSDHWIKGSVYRGNISGDEVVIKKMDVDVSKEISVLNKINHFNLIRLLGVCFDDGVWYFVYEYASNGPLRDWIFQDNPDGKTLSLGKRIQVACDVATGLNYLHTYTNPPHIHKDIRSSNVLLNNEFRAKIAKFGLSRPIKGNDGQFTLTNHIVGTKGYLAPEYLENGVVSPMLDVYAFGVLFLEMLAGRDVASLYEGVKVHLSEILSPVLSEDGNLSLKEFMDSSLGEDYPTDIAYTMLVLVDSCLRKDPGKRPFMDEIVQILSKTLTTSLIWGSTQQSYGDSNCPAYNNASTALGYDCNGVNRTCQTFLIYRAQPAYNTISSIASLLSANASEVSAINSNISVSKALATDTEVIVPLTCSCAGRFYQANTSYVVQTNENYYVINTNKFESLTTCNAIQIQKTSPNVINVFPDDKLNIPLRCACPTRKQFDAGIRHLITYVIQSGNAIASIAHRFGADVGQTLEANGKSEQNSVIQPNTTLLVPKWAYFGVGIVVGAAFISVAGTILFCMLLGKLTKKKNDPIVSLRSFEAQEKAVTEKSLETETESLVFLESISKIASLKVYSFKDLQAATENFSADHWIKGSVYKGNVNGDEVVIKKMDGDVSKEINVLNKINHLNLIRLLGVCFQDGIWYFVYEYAGNGPLSDWIYQDSPDKKNLSWGQRMQVAFDVATGLNYLHRYTSPPHVHKDIKSRNVLLTDKFRGKIAKFGLARPVMGNDGQFTLTKHIVGTKGYLAPEYLENGIVSPMLDVYAFGVLLLEMLTGKDVAFLYEGVKVHLSEVLGPLVKEEDGISNLKDFMDTSLGEDYPADIAYTMLVLVDHCLRKDQGKRPSMDEIVQILSKTLTTSLIWGSSTSAGNSSS
uniref:Uncharacterized protein n=1 Tax=Chenopodium quinoa TaxID=63459 RepID=A0A803KVZ9_CHEQI